MNSIIIKELSKSYTTQSTDIIIDHVRQPVRTRTVLQDMNLTIPIGQMTVIVGRSGCGKSTLLRLLNGETEADSGEICMPEGWHTALLSPDPYVITWTSVLRNVALAAGAGRTPEERMNLAERLVRLVRLEAYADLTPAELSTGMRQRLGLARVLASQAQLLLMDEPFASLDFITREELQNELLTIQKTMPRTVVLVTHQLDEALLLGQRIVVMHQDSTLREFDLTELPYPRDLDTPLLRQLKREVTEECKK
ncbi:MAG: ABC transporter ATP-binding protein [Clostridiales bacterium]|nr:ABC transporter ATP-binding protein [Candidatus Cacconaster stercorequi]